mmetsp:Transcript_16735/g.26722  ORF Transcript_16735/g.26722 Transcript_16735/m.26722 type:complete len:131 (-) Transcript_16735:126-518(-)
MCELHVYEGELHAGDVIYIPNSSPHGALNLEETIAITANYASPRDSTQMAYYRADCDKGSARPLCKHFEGGGEEEFAFMEKDYFSYAGYTESRWCEERRTALQQSLMKAGNAHSVNQELLALERFCETVM